MTSIPPYGSSSGALPVELTRDDFPVRRRLLSDTTLHVYEARRPGMGRRVAELWRYRALTRYFAVRYIRKGYGRSWLGWIWLPLKPVLHIGSRVLVFGWVLQAPSDGVPYLLFFLVGTAVWHLFSMTAMFATRS